MVKTRMVMWSGEFQENHQVVQTEDDGSGKQQVKTDIDGNVETEAFLNRTDGYT